MFECRIENEYGEQLMLSNNPNYTVYQIDGLNPPDATINRSPVANFDGSKFNSSRVNDRNVVIYLTIDRDCETNRINLYRYARSKRYIKFYFKNGVRDVFIEGYVENMPIEFFEMKQRVQISIICPYPHFKSVQNTITDFSALNPLFVFPFAYEEAGQPFSELQFGGEKIVLNSGDIENGVIITMQAIGKVLNPSVYNFSKNEFFKLNVDLAEGDKIVINTCRQSKSITLTHNGVSTDIINKKEFGSTWFQLLVGDNIFSYDADEFPENLLCSLTHCNEYEGV